MKTLSIQQPYASLVAYGVKKIENRTWQTNYRGKILIHASGDEWAWPDASMLPQKFIDKLLPYAGKKDITGICPEGEAYSKLIKDCFAFYGQEFDPESDLEWLKSATKEKGYPLKAQCIIGEVEIIDIVKNHSDDFADQSCYNWVLANAVVYDKPIANVVGRLRLWEYEG